MISFRAAAQSDIEAVLDFWANAAEDSHRPADTAGALRRLIVRDPDALLLAVDGEQIIGSVIAGWDGWRCHLYRLAVDPNELAHRVWAKAGYRKQAEWSRWVKPLD